MITADFSPASPAGSLVPSVLGAMGQSQSLMQRAQQMEQARAQEERQQQQFEILRPALEAKAVADVATAQGAVAGMARVQALRAKAAVIAPQAQDELFSATQIPNFEQQDAALAGLQAKYSWMENIPEFKPFVDSINNARAKSVTMALANKHLESAQAVAEINANRAITVEQERADVMRENAQLRAENEKYKADTAAAARTTSAETAAGGRTGAAEIYAGGRMQSSAGRVFEEEANALERAATAETDADAKLILQRKAQAYRDKAEKVFKSATPAASSNSPSRTESVSSPAVAPTVVDKNASTVTVGGVTYPVFKDANGNRAYKVDGHFVPLVVQ